MVWTADAETLVLQYAANALSMAAAAQALGTTRNAVNRRARKLGARFHAPYVKGGGCDRQAALRGWETRRQRRGVAA